MRLLITLGMVIVFISAFFSFYLVDMMLRNPGPFIAVGAIIIFFFVVIDAIAIYLVITNVIRRTKRL